MGNGESSGSFDRLDPGIQRWIWRQGWDDLRPIQERAIPLLLPADQDLILAAPTAGGKTEAAFLPILTTLAQRDAEGLGALVVSPLKALINDQHRRLEELGGEIGIPVHRWHGDVGQAKKRQVLEGAGGLLLITPESLEALFVRRGPALPELFADLLYVVIDELHSFIGSERGRQLQSLLHRVELATRRSIPRVGLSATLGDLGLAAEHLRPGQPERVESIEDRDGGGEVRLQVRGYRRSPQVDSEAAGGSEDSDGLTPEAESIGQDLFRRLRGGHHLIFANRRRDVESYADLLGRFSETERVPREFHPHHGSLSAELRSAAEKAMQEARPASILCTTTLELGIDVGRIESVAQIGAPPSVASMRQRLGRSGRAGRAPSILRIYLEVPPVDVRTPPHVEILPTLVQTVAMVELLIEGWVEPPRPEALHLSTLVQQLLSMIAQHGGVSAEQAYGALCRSGPFRGVEVPLFRDFLRCLGEAELIRQVHTGELVVDLAGERLLSHYSFYAAFSSPEEYRLVAHGKTLGTLPISSPLYEGLYLIFGGRRWRVLGVDDEAKVVTLEAAPGGRVPNFPGASSAQVHDEVRRRMLQVYRQVPQPRYLDRRAARFLAEACEAYSRLGLDERSLVPVGEDCLFFPWVGDLALGTLAVWLGAFGDQRVTIEGVALRFEARTPETVLDLLDKAWTAGPPDPLRLAAAVGTKQSEKHHVFLDDRVLDAELAADRFDPGRAHQALQVVLGATEPG